MWRAFVYDAKPGSDRIAQAYDTLKPFDGRFAHERPLQVKNGPLDFQPREPFHPLFGGDAEDAAHARTADHAGILGPLQSPRHFSPMWREFLDSDTYARGPGSTVTKVVDGSLYGQRLTGIAGVANTGRIATGPAMTLPRPTGMPSAALPGIRISLRKRIAEEWIHMTFTRDASGG